MEKKNIAAKKKAGMAKIKYAARHPMKEAIMPASNGPKACPILPPIPR